MSDDTTMFLDLDSVVPEKEVVVKLGGQDHKLVPITVEGFIQNTKEIEAFTKITNPTPEDEISLTIGMLQRSFPTMTAELLRGLTVLQLNKLNEFAQSNNGAKKVEEEAAAENPPTAGQ